MERRVMTTHPRIVATLLLWAGCAHAPPTSAPVPVLGRAMELEAERLDGDGRLRLSDLRGRVVLVDVWASWCVPCREAIPEWTALRERIGATRFEVVGVSIDAAREEAVAFAAELAPVFPVVWDDGRFMRDFPIETMPTMFLLDRAGRVRFVHEGFEADTAGTIETEVRMLLGD
jgi:thiol-disulfide isomerase/thioredoxin